MALIRSFTKEDDITAQELKEFLKIVRKNFLHELKENFLPKLIDQASLENFSFKILKRTEFKIPKDNIEPKFLKKPMKDTENFSELINQMASVEGMLFVLENETESRVLRAHPTQTSLKVEVDHDLMLLDEGEGCKKYYEISDVVSGKDTNGKFTKDLNTLLKSFDSNSTRKEVEKYFIVTSLELWQGYRSNATHQHGYYEFDVWFNENNELFVNAGMTLTESNFLIKISELKTCKIINCCILEVKFEEKN